jgi:hypothetical protein
MTTLLLVAKDEPTRDTLHEIVAGAPRIQVVLERRHRIRRVTPGPKMLYKDRRTPIGRDLAGRIRYPERRKGQGVGRVAACLVALPSEEAAGG